MANALFATYRNIIVGNSATALVDWNADTMKISLLDTGAVTPNLATNAFWSDLVAGVVGTPVTLTSVTYPAAGTVTAANPTFTSVTGASAEELVIYKFTGTNSTSPLCALYDTFTSGMPVTPNGGDIAITVNASGLAQIAG